MNAGEGWLWLGKDLKSDLGLSDELVSTRCCFKTVHPVCVYLLASEWVGAAVIRTWSMVLIVKSSML